MEENVQAVPRDIDTVTREICEIKSRVQSLALMYAVEIGRRLAEAKEMLPHGEWGKWLSEKVDFAPRTAQRLMLAAEEFGGREAPSLLIFSKTTPVSYLPYTKALELLALPAEERGEFAAEHDLSDMTRKEIADAVRERDEARRETAEAEKRARAAEEAVQASKELQDKLAAAERAAEAARKDLADAKKCAEKQVKDACASARREAQAEACKKAEKELEDARKKAAEAIKTQEEAAAAAAQAKARADALEKKLKMASPALALFRSRFEDLQAEVQRLRSMLTTIRQDDQDTAAKLTAALAAYFESEAKKT